MAVRDQRAAIMRRLTVIQPSKDAVTGVLALWA
jgi:hypothetical protein